MEKRLIYALLSLLVSLCFYQCTSSKGEDLPESKEVSTYAVKSYHTLTAEVRNIAKSVHITGRVIPIHKVAITAKVQGTVLETQKGFEEGNTFAKGEILLSIDSKEFELNLAAQRSRFLNALVRIMSDMKMDHSDNFSIWKAYLAKVKVEETLPNLPEGADAKLRYFLAANNIFDLYYQIKAQEQKLKDFSIYAPFSGALTMASVDPGDLVRPNVKLGEFIRTDIYEIRSAISVQDIENLKIGQQLEMYSLASDERYEAKIVRFGKSVDPTTQAVSVFMRVKGGKLKEGMYLEGDVSLESFPQASEIPKEVLTRDNQVYVIKNSMVVLQSVEVLESGNTTAIVKGLEKGDLIISEPVYQPILGTKAQSK